MTRRNPNPRHRQQPLPSIYYTRRRVAALIVLLVVIAIIIALFAFIHSALSGDDDHPDNAASVTSSTPSQAPSAAVVTTQVTQSPTTQPETSSSVVSSQSLPTPTTTIVKNADTKQTCQLSDLIIGASTDKPNYGPGQLPVLFMTVKNPTAADCSIDLNANVLRFEIYDLKTNKRVWADIDCNDSEGVGTVTYPAGKTVTYKAVWSRKGSAPNQCDKRTYVPAGGYYLHTLIGNNHSDAATFNLN